MSYTLNLRENDVRKVKSNLVSWGKENPNAVLLFNSTIISEIFWKMDEQQISGYRSGNTITIENITIQWYCIGGSKAVLKNITDNETGWQYETPSSWKGCEIWHQAD